MVNCLFQDSAISFLAAHALRNSVGLAHVGRLFGRAAGRRSSPMPDLGLEVHPRHHQSAMRLASASEANSSAPVGAVVAAGGGSLVSVVEVVVVAAVVVVEVAGKLASAYSPCALANICLAAAKR